MVRQRRFQFLPGSSLIASLEQRHPEMVSESGSVGVLLHKVRKGLDGAVTHALFQVDVTDGIGEIGLSWDLLNSVLGKSQCLVQIAASIGEEKCQVIHRRPVV